MSFYCIFTTYQALPLGTGHSSEQDGHSLHAQGSKKEKIKTQSKTKINEAVTNCDKCCEENKEESKKEKLQKRMSIIIF